MAIEAAVPASEPQRLARIRELCLLDQMPDTVFDRIVQLAAHHFEVPIALVSIVDEGRQWFCARVGLDAQETPRRDSFCAHALHDPDLFQVGNALQDPRFHDNPLVVGAPGIRFYAGMPLVTDDGLALGTLCLIDIKPRAPLDDRQTATLAMLARLVMDRIQTLRHRNFIDGPTGLPNRQRLEDDVRARRAAGESLVVVVADVLAPVFTNELVKALGYRFTLQLLLSLKARLEAVLPQDAVLYRICHRRFAFLLADTDTANTEALLDAVACAIRLPVETDGIPIVTAAGFGALRLGQGQGDDPEDWVRSAISAADEARECEHGWLWYDPRVDRAQQRAFHLLSALGEAVNGSGQLHLHYQPRIDLRTGTCSSVEALLRWEHPEFGSISPAEFVPLAEKTALMRPLSLWVLRHAIDQLARWDADGHRLQVAINVSAVDLESDTFTEHMLVLLAERGLAPDRLEIEFTESALMRRPEVVRQQLERLRRLGVAVAIDDFGTGYSNWTYLRALPANSVKIDRSFLVNLQETADERLLRTIIDLARELGYRVVAEGIETERQRQLMRDWGCHEGQGFLFARPMPADAMPTWLAGRG